MNGQMFGFEIFEDCFQGTCLEIRPNLVRQNPRQTLCVLVFSDALCCVGKGKIRAIKRSGNMVEMILDIEISDNFMRTKQTKTDRPYSDRSAKI